LQRFCRADYGGYVRDLNGPHLPTWRAYVRWIRHTMQWRRRFGQASVDNPFHHDPAAEAGYWFPPP
jgi:hypothetical protein